MRLSCLIFIKILFAFAFLFFTSCRRTSIVVLDTQNGNTKNYNSAPMGFKYREVLLALERNETLWGALRLYSDCTLITHYDLSNGNILATYQLPPIDVIVSYSEFSLFFPESLDFIYCKASYAEALKKRTTEIVKYNIKTNKSKILYKTKENAYGKIARVDNNKILFVENSSDGPAILILLNIHNGEYKKCHLLPQQYTINSVSPNGKYAVISTTNGLFLVNLSKMVVTNVLSSSTRVTTYNANFNKLSSRIVYSINAYNIFIYNISTGNQLRLNINQEQLYRIYGCAFLNESMVVYLKKYNTQDNKDKIIVLYNLDKKEIEKEISIPFIKSELLVCGKYIVFED